MGERVTAGTTVAATPAAVYGVIADLDGYPTWAPELRRAAVLERDGDGLPTMASFTLDAQVAQLDYTLQYQHDRPGRVRWRLIEGELLRRLDGQYRLTPIAGGTQVDYALEADLAMPLPGALRRRAVRAIMHSGLTGLRDRVEELA